MLSAASAPIGRTIARIEVDELFGRYSYRLPDDERSIDRLSRLFILYGDNGSGKTTLLRLVFDLLSPAGNQGHRARLGKVPFRRLRITLHDGSLVEAVRDEGKTGSYELVVGRVGHGIVRAAWNAQAREGSGDAADDSAWAKAIEALESLRIALYFMTDDRRIRSDAFPDELTTTEERIRR